MVTIVLKRRIYLCLLLCYNECLFFLNYELFLSFMARPFKRKRGNYWTPLQALDDDGDSMDSDETTEAVIKNVKEHIPPIKVLGQGGDFIHKILTEKGIVNYRLKRMSIGTKIFCDTIASYGVVKTLLSEKNCQFFTHDIKSDRVFKVVLFGLETKTEEQVKAELTSRNLQCTQVKRVDKTYENFVDTIYIVSFVNGSLKLNDLRRDHKCIFRTIVRWEYQRKNKNRIVQCHNCQMFGHGEKGCSVRTKCSNCAGKHKTVDCKANTAKCANCNGNHKSSDLTCPNREMYLEIRSKFTNKKSNNNVRRSNNNVIPYNTTQFPLLPKQREVQQPHINQEANASQNQRELQQIYVKANASQNLQHNNNNVNKNDLFTIEEITQLSTELINKLRVCTSKEQQFNVLTELTIKYLYSNVK